MARAKSRRRKGEGIYDRVKAHMDATAEAEQWARQGLELVKAGKHAEARLAHRKAESAMRRREALELAGQRSFDRTRT